MDQFTCDEQRHEQWINKCIVDVWIMYRELADTVSKWIDELLG